MTRWTLWIAAAALPFLLAPARAAAPPEHLALVARAEAVMAKAGTTPGREFANRLRSERYPEYMQILKGELTVEPDELKRIVEDVTRVIGLAEQGLTWPLPPLARVPRARTAPVIDGKLNDDGWARAWADRGIWRFNTTEAGGPATVWKMLWDDKYLYCAFDCVDEDLASPLLPRDGAVFNDDCVEMFLMPAKRFRTYWEIVVGPSGSIFDSVECKHADLWGGILDPAQTVEGLKIGIDLRGTLNNGDDTDAGYTVEIAVPWSQLPEFDRKGPQAGDRMHLMLVRLDRSRGKFGAFAWRPLLGWGHNIWNHGELELEG